MQVKYDKPRLGSNPEYFCNYFHTNHRHVFTGQIYLVIDKNLIIRKSLSDIILFIYIISRIILKDKRAYWFIVIYCIR